MRGGFPKKFYMVRARRGERKKFFGKFFKFANKTPRFGCYKDENNFKEEGSMKKSRIFLTFALIGVAALPLAACNGGNGRTSGPSKAETGTYYGIESTESVYGVAAVTTAKLLQASSFLPATVSLSGGTAPNSVSGEAEDFNKYFNMLDSFLDKAETKTTVEANPSSDPALAAYPFKLTVTGKNAAGEDVAHTVYFSETAGAAKTDTRTDGDETTTVESTTYTLSGAVEMGTAEDGAAVYYRMEGTRVERTKTETEGLKTEVERESVLTMRAYREGDANDYVELTHTSGVEEEGGEREQEAVYTYRTYAQGKLVEATEICLETENEGTMSESEYSVRFLSGASRGYYEIEKKTAGGKTSFEVEYTLDGERGRFIVVKDGENYRYKFSDDAAEEENFRDFDD